MRQLTWWMRVVGILYVINGVGLVFAYLVPDLGETMVTQAVPSADPNHPLADWGMEVWLMFGFEMLVVGGTVLAASRNAWRHRIIAYMVVGLETIRGVADDLVWIANGYPAGIYVGWIVFHIAVIVTGVLALRRASADAPSELLAAA